MDCDGELDTLTGEEGTRSDGLAPAAAAGSPVALGGAHRERVEAALNSARSEHTTANYRAQWRRFTVWASGEGLEAMPAHPATVAAYLAWRAEQGASVSTVRVARAAISAAHRDRGLEDPTQHEGVKRTVAGVSRQQADRPLRQAQALTAEALAVIRATAKLPRASQRRESVGRTPGAPRSAATATSRCAPSCAMGFCAALRRPR